MKYYNLIVTKEYLDPETHKRTWMRDLEFSKVFSTREKAIEYWDTWKKSNEGYIQVTEEHLYQLQIDEVSLEGETEDCEIDDLMYTKKRYHISVDYYAPDSEYNKTGVDKYFVRSSGILNVGCSKINEEIRFRQVKQDFITVSFELDSTPMSFRIDAEEKARIIVESSWWNKIRDLVKGFNPQQRCIECKANSMKDFLSGNFTVNTSSWIKFCNGISEFI